jgi:hypothetical protein
MLNRLLAGRTMSPLMEAPHFQGKAAHKRRILELMLPIKFVPGRPKTYSFSKAGRLVNTLENGPSSVRQKASTLEKPLLSLIYKR